MNWNDLGKTLMSVGLPLLGAALPVPGGAAIGARLAAALGTGASPEEIAAALASSEEARTKAAEFQASHAERMTALLNDFATRQYATEVDDRKDARRAAVDGGTSRHAFWFAVLIFVGVLAVEAAVLLLGLPEGVEQAASGRILGTLDAALLVALYWVYGSSSGSARKTELQKPEAGGR